MPHHDSASNLFLGLISGTSADGIDAALVRFSNSTSGDGALHCELVHGRTYAWPEVLRARLVVEGEAGNDRMTLKAEAKGAPEGLAAALVASIREVTKLRGEVEVVAPGSLPNDGKVIEDLRKYY